MASKLTKQTESVEIARDTLVVAYKRAESLGLSLTEYVQSLIDKDAQTEKKDPWREPIPRHVSERWEREIAEFDEQEKINPRPVAKSVAEFRELLEKEVAQLPDDE